MIASRGKVNGDALVYDDIANLHIPFYFHLMVQCLPSEVGIFHLILSTVRNGILKQIIKMFKYNTHLVNKFQT